MDYSTKITAMVEHYSDENVKGLCRKALAFSPVAQKQFLRVFSLEFALDGQLYGGGGNRKLFPELMSEAVASGIEVVG